MSEFMRVTAVEPHDATTLRVTFTNAATRLMDVAPYTSDGPIFEPVRSDPQFFRRVQVVRGTVTWPNGADIDPDVLYYAGPPPWAADVRTATEQHE